MATPKTKPTRINKATEKRRLDRLRSRIVRLESLLAKRRAEFVARKREYDGDGSHYWVMFASPAGVGLDVVTWAGNFDEAVESACGLWPEVYGDPVAWRLRKPWTGPTNEPLTDEQVMAVAKIAED